MPETIESRAPYGAKMPAVTVVVGNYNQAPFVEAAIRSVADQTYGAFQCIVVDDVSTDHSVARIRSCLDDLEDSRFRLIEHERNAGQMACMLTGSDADDAPFVAFLDGDDVWHPAFLECHVRAHLNPSGMAAISCSDMVLIDENDVMWAGGYPSFRRHDPRSKPPPGADRRLPEGAEPGSPNPFLAVEGEGEETLVFVKPGSHGWIWSATSAMMFRRGFIDTMRPDNTDDIRICADNYWANLAHLVGGTVLLRRALGNYRVHHNNSWASRLCFGDRSALGWADPSVDRRIHEAIARQICTKFETLSATIHPPYLVRSLIAFLGVQQARKLCDRDSGIRDVLGEHLAARKGTAKPKRPIARLLASLRGR